MGKAIRVVKSAGKAARKGFLGRVFSGFMRGKGARNTAKEGFLDRVFNQNVRDSVLAGVGIAAGLKGISAGLDYLHERKAESHFDDTIEHAIKQHPELKSIPRRELKEQLRTFYTLAPHIATDKKLGTSMLYTVNSYGGNIDLATAKLLAEIGEKREKQRPRATDEMIMLVNSGRGLSGK